MSEDLDFSPDEAPEGEEERAKHSWIGVVLRDRYQEMEYRFPASTEVPVSYGPVVEKVRESSPAARAGVAVGDMIMQIDGEQITSAQALSSKIRSKSVGDIIMVQLNRNGTQILVKILIEDGLYC